MSKELVRMERYGVLTFNTTAHALKAEKVLKNNKACFIVIPTPREISASCGLAVKMEQSNIEAYYNLLQAEQVPVAEVYRIQEVGNRKKLEKIEK